MDEEGEGESDEACRRKEGMLLQYMVQVELWRMNDMEH